jgi:ubiquinol-cytochrome c reductase iron-sulfur subunit
MSDPNDSIRDRLKAPAGHGEQAGEGDTARSDLTTNDFVQTDSRSAHGQEHQTIAVSQPESHVGESPLLRDDPIRAKRAEMQVSALFLLSVLGVIGFVVTYIAVPHNFGEAHSNLYTPLLGIFMTLALVGIGAGAVLWAKTLMVDEETIQERHHLNSDPEDRTATAEVLKQGAADSRIMKHPMLRRTFLLSQATLGIMIVPLLFSLGKFQFKEKTLSTTGWKKGSRLLDELGRPLKVGDLEVGGVKTVFPDVPGGRRMADSASLLIRMRPDELKVSKERENWSFEGHIVYSIVCTHLGCPVKLYERQTHHLFCPCHQSTFDASNEAKVLFGPAARNLPQLAIDVDSEGYFIARGDYNEPVGPSFWERKPHYKEPNYGTEASS